MARAQGARQRRFEGGRALYSTRGAARGSWRAGKVGAAKTAVRGGAPVSAEREAERRKKKGGLVIFQKF